MCLFGGLLSLPFYFSLYWLIICFIIPTYLSSSLFSYIYIYIFTLNNQVPFFHKQHVATGIRFLWIPNTPSSSLWMMDLGITYVAV